MVERGGKTIRNNKKIARAADVAEPVKNLQSVNLLHLTIFTGKVLDSYILDGDLLQEIRTLAARVTGDDALPSQPVAEPRQVTVTVEGIGQKVAGKQRVQLEMLTVFFLCVCVFICICIMCPRVCVRSQRGQGVQRVECSGVHGGDLVVVERQETH